MSTLLAWVERSYPYAVVRRFFELELLDRSFALAAQVFVALLPIVIVVVSLFTADGSQLVAQQIIDRFGLAGAATVAVRDLFGTPGGEMAISWLAIIISFLSAFSLSRRLARTYAAMFRMPPLPRSKSWHGLVWIALQIVVLLGTSYLRDVYRTYGIGLSLAAVVGLLAFWFSADIAGYRLLVPTLPRRTLVPAAICSVVGRIGLSVWAGIYMPATLSNQAVQFGPLGVTFSLFTFFLAGVMVLLVAPLLVVVWQDRRLAPEGQTVPLD